MTKFPIPENEDERQRELREYRVLDTEPEEAFDDLVRLAAAICETPMSLVSLIDAERQWFKARLGVDVCETPRDLAFCAHAMLGEDLFVVEDATRDPRFADNPFVTGEFGLRFYAGMPLRTPSGHGLGTLCVLDRESRRLSEGQKTALATLGRAVMAQLELRRQVAESERHTSEREAVRRDLDRIFSLSLDLICVAGTDGYFKKLNPAFTEVLGHTREEMLGRPFLDFVHPDDVESTRREAEKLAEGVKTIWFENRYRTKEGSYRWLGWKAVPVPEEDVMYAVGRDITELKRHEEELAVARDVAVEASRLKSQFLANMSHELRTPLNSIIGFSELLLDRVPGALNDDQAQCVTDVLESGEHLLSLINDILDLSKIEAGKMDVKPEAVDAASVVESAVAALRPLAAKKDLTVETRVEEGLEPMWADPAKVRQILINLLSNAVKFTDEGGRIRVQALRSSRSPEMVEIEVEDSGIGIAADQHDVVFDEFRQVENRSRATLNEGTGLGLSLCRKFLQLMGGTIRLQSEPGRGSTFSFTLPSARGRTSAGLEALGSSARIVVIEDDAENARLTRRILESADYEVQVTHTGGDGLNLVRRTRPDVVITDMTADGGWSLLEQIKADPEIADIPVIFLSVVHDPRRGAELGAFYSLMKPLDRHSLLSAVRSGLGLNGTHLEGRTILVVDDDPAVLRLTRTILEEAGARVLVVGGGEEGVHLALSAVPDLVLLDLLMPRVTGFDVVQRLAAESATRAIPIIVLTAKDLTAEDREKLDGRVSQLIDKERLRPRDLVRAVEKVLDARS